MEQSHYIKNRILIDTNALIRYFDIKIPNSNIHRLSQSSKDKINKGLCGEEILFVSTISIIEIWANIESSKEGYESLRSTIKQLYEQQIRIVTLSNFTLKCYSELEIGTLKEHDRIIYASAKEFECNMIISCDPAIKKYIQRYDKNSISILE